MIIAEMRTWFDILQDKYNSPYFTDSEKDEFLEDAMWDIINGVIGDLDTPSTMEKSKGSLESIKTLINPDTITTDANGVLLDTAFFDIEGSVAAPPVYILSMALASGVPLHPVRHSDIGKFEDNTFKAGTATYPNYTVIQIGYQIYPTSLTTTPIDVVYIAEPTAVTDLPIRMHRKQVAKAMVKTGLVTEAQALTMMEQVTNG